MILRRFDTLIIAKEGSRVNLKNDLIISTLWLNESNPYGYIRQIEDSLKGVYIGAAFLCNMSYERTRLFQGIIGESPGFPIGKIISVQTGEMR